MYRSDSINGKYKKIATTTKTNYYDSKAKEGITYYYKIKVSNNNTSDFSSKKSARTYK